MDIDGQVQPDRVIGEESYFALRNALKYWSWKIGLKKPMSYSNFQETVNRLNITRWNIPKGSRDVYLKQADLDAAAVPVPVKHARAKARVS